MPELSVRKPGDRPAFPEMTDGGYARCGLTIREYFAIKILAGFAADPQCDNYTIQKNAETAVMWADALVAELNKPTEAKG